MKTRIAIPDFAMQGMAANAVDIKMLATNLPEIGTDCCSGAGIDLRNELINRFPVVEWLLNTQLTREVNAARRENGYCHTHLNEEGKWVMEMPKSIWTTLPTSSSEECCWTPFDFAKCGGFVPLNLLCLKDCEDIMSTFMGRNVTVNTSIAGLQTKGETLNDVKRRIARLSMAFLTAYNVMLGLDDTYTDILKPFHGLLQVMENPAVAKIYGGNILSAFDALGCRLSLLGGRDYGIAVNPVVYDSIEEQIRPGQYGELPSGWYYRGDELTFRGIGFIRDRHMPVDLDAGTGEAWILTGQAVGLFLATNLMPEEPYIRTGFGAGTPEENCGSQCTHYFNVGAVLNNNANLLAQIVDIPISGACAAATGDLGGLIMPKTLIPKPEG